MQNDDLEIFAVTIRRPEDAKRFHNEHVRRHFRQHDTGLVVRITGPNGRIRDSGLLLEEALRELGKNQGEVTLIARNLPPTNPYEANRYWFRRTPHMELRLHVQRPGAPSLLEAIAAQDALDWQEARAHCILAGRPVPPGEKPDETRPGEWLQKLKRALGRMTPVILPLTLLAGAGCAEPGPARAAQVRPATMTEEIRAYSYCIAAAQKHQFSWTMASFEERNQHIRTRCRLLEPAGMDHAPGSPENNRCSDEYFLWQQAEHGHMSKHIERHFSETVCAAKPPQHQEPGTEPGQ